MLPIPKSLVSMESVTVKLIWSDGNSSESYYLYAAYEWYVCVLEGSADEAEWEKLTFIQAL